MMNGSDPGRARIVVPTLGRSGWLGEALARLRADAGDRAEIVVVHSGDGTIDDGDLEPADRVIRSQRRLSFAESCNWGLDLEGMSEPWAGVVNDDLLVEPGWLDALRGALSRDGGLACVQGAYVRRRDPAKLDGCGIGWNVFWRPVQLAHDRPAARAPAASIDIFGTSATAALYRAQALRAVSFGDNMPFDPGLGTYYEDVELAIRLRGAGWAACCVPSARALHEGGATSRTEPWRREALRARNRLLVAASLSRRKLPWRASLLVSRDIAEMAARVLAGQWAAAAGIPFGWLWAARRLPDRLRAKCDGARHLDLARFRVRRAKSWPPE